RLHDAFRRVLALSNSVHSTTRIGHRLKYQPTKSIHLVGGISSSGDEFRLTPPQSRFVEKALSVPALQLTVPWTGLSSACFSSDSAEWAPLRTGRSEKTPFR